MVPQPDCQRVVWCGPRTGGLGWLHNKIDLWCRAGQVNLKDHSRTSDHAVSGESHEKRPFGMVTADDVCSSLKFASEGSRRIILAFENRWDYTETLMRQLTVEFPDVPVALAASDWWLGWRRTGIGHFGSMPSVCLPWFRWWDGWVPWLEGSCASMYGPFPNSLPHAAGSNSRTTTQRGRHQVESRHGSLAVEGRLDYPFKAIVIGSCPMAVQNWLWTLDARRGSAMAVQTEDATQSAEQELVGNCIQTSHLPMKIKGPEKPDWVLWDDTRIATLSGPEAGLSHATSELIDISQRYPECLLFVAWTLPVWAIVQKLQEAKLRLELLAKPYFGNFSSAALMRT